MISFHEINKKEKKKNTGKKSHFLLLRSSVPTVSFADVAGCDGAKQELLEVVTFLRDPEKFAAVARRQMAI